MRKTLYLLPAIFILFFASTFYLFSCKKADVLATPDVALQASQQRFFAMPATALPEAKAIAAAIQRQDAQYHFLPTLIANAGYPVWDKIKIANITTGSISGKGAAGSGGEVVYVPFVLDSQEKTNAVLSVKLSADTIYRMIYANQYKSFGYDTADHAKWNVRDIFHLFTLFDNSLFGYTQFLIKDKLLFPGKENSSTIATLVKPQAETNATGRTNYQMISCDIYTFCEVLPIAKTSTTPQCWDVPVCTIYGGGGTSGGGSSGGIGSGGPSGGTGGGGGGGIGSGDGSSNPCGTGRMAKVPPGCGTGWEPLPINRTFNPYSADSVIIDPLLLNTFPCVQKIINSLTQYSNTNALAQVALNTIFGVNKKIHLTYQLNPAWGRGNEDGDTRADSAYTVGVDFYATIRLNPWVLAHSTQEYIAATIIHESVHAYIDFKYYQYKTGIIDSTAFKTLFPLFWPPKTAGISNNAYMYQIGNSSQHQAMAAALIDIMQAPLTAMYPNLTIRTSLRDSIYRSISWGGLTETAAYGVQSDSLLIIAMNTIARDTGIHAPFIINHNNSSIFTTDSHNSNMKKGCQ